MYFNLDKIVYSLPQLFLRRLNIPLGCAVIWYLAKFPDKEAEV
jgi:hypothetical protein